METAHHLRFYQAQYQPSFIGTATAIDPDQAKVDEYLAMGADALNTPNIDPDFFNEGNLFSNEKVHLKSAKVDPLLGGGATEDVYNLGSSSTLISNNNFQMNQNQNQNSLQTMPTTSSSSSSYSPQQQLEISSQIININSPEMMLSSSASSASSSSPNKSYNSLESGSSYLGNIEDDPAFYSQVAEYEQLAFYGSPETGYIHQHQNSAPNSRSSSISSGSGCEGTVNGSNYEYLLADCLTSSEVLNSTINSTSTSSTSTNSINNRQLAPSPASSHYSSDSVSSKTFTNLDAIQQQQQQQQILAHSGHQLISIKQEPVDSAILYQPTVIEEFESSGLQQQQQQQQLYQPIDNSQYSTISAADLAYYCTPQQQQQQYNSQLPSTVSSVLLQPQMQQQQQQLPQRTPATSGRKRNAAAAFSGAASTASSSSSSTSTSAAGATTGTTTTTTTSGSKKPRMTKREKQKMMESDIGKFETENRDLRQSIDLLERQIAFCKRFLSENVAPVIQRQAQNSSTTGPNGQFNCSPMMIAVSEM